VSGPSGPPTGPPVRRDDERGMTTAEYAVGTVGVACLACVLIWLDRDGWWEYLIMGFLDVIGDLPMFQLP